MNIFRRFLNTENAPELSMELKSYESFGPVNFTDNYKTVLKKLKPYTPKEIGKQSFKRDANGKMDHLSLKGLYIESAKLHIVFNASASGVEYFEVERGSFIHNGNDIFKMGYTKAQEYAESLDNAINFDEDEGGFDSPGLGFTVSRVLRNSKYTNTIEYAVAFSRESTKEVKPTTEDILAAYGFSLD